MEQGQAFVQQDEPPELAAWAAMIAIEQALTHAVYRHEERAALHKARMILWKQSEK